jgi:membrane-associated phospholipid phosphatase
MRTTTELATSTPSSLPAFVLPVGLFILFWSLCHTPLAGLIGVVRTGAKRASAWIMGSRMGKWSFGHSGPLGSYAPIFLVMILGGIATICAGYLFVVLVEQFQRSTSLVYHADQIIQTWFGHERQPAMTVLLSAATSLGSTAGLGVIVGVVTAILFLRKERASAIFVIVTAVTGALLNLGLKAIFARARPDLTFAITTSRYYSFPSGHAMGSFISLGALAYIALRQKWPWSTKTATLATILTLIVLVGLSRVYLGVHWASDIVGGWSAGTVWLSAAVVAFEMLLRLRQRRRGAAPTSPAAEVPDKPVPAHPVTA